jgi:hypothetical protein
MNEKIKELAKRATTQYSPAYYSEKWTEKFAELIVRECLKFECEAGVYTKHDMSDAIRRHFGVEP